MMGLLHRQHARFLAKASRSRYQSRLIPPQ
jgi:hypothetical protein